MTASIIDIAGELPAPLYDIEAKVEQAFEVETKRDPLGVGCLLATHDGQIEGILMAAHVDLAEFSCRAHATGKNVRFPITYGDDTVAEYTLIPARGGYMVKGSGSEAVYPASIALAQVQRAYADAVRTKMDKFIATTVSDLLQDLTLGEVWSFLLASESLPD